MSLDGRIALKNGDSKWITSKYARQDVQIFRAKSSVMLSTSSTILIDDPYFTVRTEEFPKKIQSIFPYKIFQHPIRAIIDSQNRIKLSHKIIQTNGPIWLIRLKSDKKTWPKNVKEIIVPKYDDNIDILSLLKIFGQQELNKIWIESGSKFSSFLLKKGLIDEIIIYIAPKILGNQAQPLFILENIIKLSECLKWNFKDIKKIGSDIRLRLEIKKNNTIL
ncbi:Riboflavin biosynthesis protein RibD, partial [5-amino-6-(5-phosphoribosylamino)uracil reductase] [Buchnera aphidicola (Cavariella theobaldi)]